MASLVLSLMATGEQAAEPLLWRLGKQFDVCVYIRKAAITEQGGSAVIELQGTVEEIQRATAWMQTTGLVIEPYTRSLTPELKPG